MKHRLMTTTALAAALALAGLSAGAQEAQPVARPDVASGAGGTSGTAAPGQTVTEAGGGAQPLFSNIGTGSAGSAGHGAGFYEAGENLVLGSAILGQGVYHLNGAQQVGTVSDLVMGGDGQFLALVVEIAGPERKEVAVDHREITWMQFQTGQRTLAMNAAPGRLGGAPAFDRAAILQTYAGRTGADPLAETPPAPVAGAGGELQDPTLQGGAGAERDGVRELSAAPQTLDGHAIVGDAAQPRQLQGLSPVQSQDAQVAGEQQAAGTQITSEEIVGMTVYGSEGERIGEVNDVILSQAGAVEAVILDVGGFLGIGAHSVAVDFGRANFVEAAGMRAVQVLFTEDQLRSQGAFDADAFRQGAGGQVLGR